MITMLRGKLVPDGGPPTDEFAPAPVKALRWLRDRPGKRAFQSDVADALEWSESKTSRVLSELEAQGRITRVWVRGEKVVVLDE